MEAFLAQDPGQPVAVLVEAVLQPTVPRRPCLDDRVVTAFEYDDTSRRRCALTAAVLEEAADR